jgi:hypothetical protein
MKLARRIGSAVVVMLTLVTGCDDSLSSAASALTVPELAALLDGGTQHVEIQLKGDGSVREVHLQAAHKDEYLEGHAISVDAASRTLELEHIGTVSFANAKEFRLASGRRGGVDEFIAAVSKGVSQGGSVFLRAKRPAVAPQLPTDAEFAARELRIEDKPDRPKLEVLIGPANFDAADRSIVYLRRSFLLPKSATLVDDKGGNDASNSGLDALDVDADSGGSTDGGASSDVGPDLSLDSDDDDSGKSDSEDDDDSGKSDSDDDDDDSGKSGSDDDDDDDSGKSGSDDDDDDSGKSGSDDDDDDDSGKSGSDDDDDDDSGKSGSDDDDDDDSGKSGSGKSRSRR